MIKKILWFLAINALALLLVSTFLGPDNMSINSNWGPWAGYIVVGFFLGVLNAIVRPILALLSLPLIIISFGLFLTIINAGLLWFSEFVFTEIFSSFDIIFTIHGGISSYLIAAIALSIVNSLLHFIKK